ncbi:MAG: hypothetical protein JNK78_06335 [Planctomycetes bacterium]|nr:hypothetical protein [Planctomycetota bacterium]
MTAPAPDDSAVLDRWWREFVATGRLPDDLAVVQTRLVRTVARGDLPSGPVFVKAMTFPRAKDRLRYALRPLPAVHEAAMLRATAAAGIRCPEVVAVRTARRFGLPDRSMLVLAALPVVPGAPPTDGTRLREEARIAARLMAAGIVHPDLHGANFVRCEGGELAVLDLQSARRRRSGPADRLAAAVRLLQDRTAVDEGAAGAALIAADLLSTPSEASRAFRLAAGGRRAFVRSRILRCFAESTEFTRRVSWCGVEHRTRGELPVGRWWRGGRELRRAWIGQRALFVLEAREPVFPAYRRNWWWLGGGGALYVPAACSDDRIEAEVRALADGHRRLANLGSGRTAVP